MNEREISAERQMFRENYSLKFMIDYPDEEKQENDEEDAETPRFQSEESKSEDEESKSANDEMSKSVNHHEIDETWVKKPSKKSYFAPKPLADLTKDH